MKSVKDEVITVSYTHLDVYKRQGLPDENHWTSADDMGLISCAAYRNDEFRKITGTKTYIIPPTNKHTEMCIRDSF